MKKLIYLFSILALIFIAQGCEEKTTIQEAYNVGISSYGGTLGDLAKIESYLTSKGCQNNQTKIYSGSSQEETDKAAKKEFETMVTKLNKNEIGLLGLSKDCYFIYAVWRSSDSNIAEFRYNK